MHILFLSFTLILFYILFNWMIETLFISHNTQMYNILKFKQYKHQIIRLHMSFLWRTIIQFIFFCTIIKKKKKRWKCLQFQLFTYRVINILIEKFTMIWIQFYKLNFLLQYFHFKNKLKKKKKLLDIENVNW